MRPAKLCPRIMHWPAVEQLRRSIGSWLRCRLSESMCSLLARARQIGSCRKNEEVAGTLVHSARDDLYPWIPENAFSGSASIST